MTLDKIEREIVEARAKYDRTEQDMKSIRKRLYRRSNKVLTLESRRRQLIKAGTSTPLSNLKPETA